MAVLNLLPVGTLPVGAGLMVLGAGMYVHLAVAGHSLPATGMAAVSVLWSLVFLLGLGVFLPIEQELIRLVAARTTVGEGIVPVVRRICLLSAVILAVIGVPLAAAAGPLARLLFGGGTAMVAELGGACLAMAVTTVSRGTLAGQGKFGAYGGQLAIDGGSRAVLACALGVAGVHSAAAFGLILTVAPLLSAALTLGPLLAGLRPGPALPWRATSRRLAMLIVTMLLAQVIINVGVISVRLLSPRDDAAVGALLAALVLARVPLFVFTSLQTALLPGLAAAVAAGDPGAVPDAAGPGLRHRGAARRRRRAAPGDLRAVADPGAVRHPPRPRARQLRLAGRRDAVLHARARARPGRAGPVPAPGPVAVLGLRGRRARGHHRVARPGDDARRSRLHPWLRDRGRRAGVRAAAARAQTRPEHSPSGGAGVAHDGPLAREVRPVAPDESLTAQVAGLTVAQKAVLFRHGPMPERCCRGS